MEKIETKKKIEIIDFIYLGVISVFIIITIILFFYSTNLIVKNINKIFVQNVETNHNALEKERYSLVEKKLNLPVNNVIVENIEIQKDTTKDIVKTENNVIDNKSLIINILNGARKAGVASSMSLSLEAVGFSKATTGDSKTVYPITTILIKDSKKDYKESIEKIVKKLHPKAITKANPEQSSFDIIIIVGKE